MKDFNKKNKTFFWVLVVILFLILVGSLGFYAWRFRGGLSNDQSIWGAFGDFFNGVVSPIFAAINIGIFWYLTTVIEDKNDQRQRESAEHERAVILMQFRKAEIDKLEEIFRNVVLPEKENNKDDYSAVTHAATRASVYILNFLQTELDLFGLKKSDKTARNLRKLNNILNDLCDNLDKAAAEEAFLYDKDIDMSNLDKTFTEFLRLKGSIIAALQKITLNS